MHEEQITQPAERRLWECPIVDGVITVGPVQCEQGDCCKQNPAPGLHCPEGMRCPCYQARRCSNDSHAGGISAIGWLMLALVIVLLLTVGVTSVAWVRQRRCKDSPCQPKLNDVTLEDKLQDPAWAAISLDQLKALREEAMEVLGDSYSEADMHTVVERVIKPQCQAHGKSWARIVNPQPLLLSAFVSHCWAENFDNFVNSVDQAFAYWTVKPHLWICATALFQSDDPIEISEQIGTGSDPSNAFFTKALAQAQKLLVVRNSAVDLYQRIWCCWELFLAYEQGMLHRPGAVMVVGPVSSPSFEQPAVDIRNAEASNPDDKKSILKHVLGKKNSYHEINAKLTEVKFFGAKLEPAS
eukprot:TRINITY_DN94007_c0_g1_i1.p1 TRINITY_DN94007_c0_g1~~TRINITY_DN94007_c0_g1_i1.p1  ORF type:complete len:409 (-),score=62.25 TRINITY_DN94007_c0_g1_i1:544-1608(-)